MSPLSSPGPCSTVRLSLAEALDAAASCESASLPLVSLTPRLGLCKGSLDLPPRLGFPVLQLPLLVSTILSMRLGLMAFASPLPFPYHLSCLGHLGPPLKLLSVLMSPVLLRVIVGPLQQLPLLMSRILSKRLGPRLMYLLVALLVSYRMTQILDSKHSLPDLSLGPLPRKVPDAHVSAASGFGNTSQDSKALADSVSRSMSTTITFLSWAASLPRWLARSRTSFGAYVAASFCSPPCRGPSGSPSATFPLLPFPFLGLFSGSGPRLSRRAWHTLCLRRLMHCVVAALNFLHGSLPWPSHDSLWRPPNTHHRACYQRIWGFVVACASRDEEFSLPPGRSGPDLLARLVELEHFAGSIGPSDYGSVASAKPAVVPDVGPSPNLPQLRPYRSLDVSRLKLSGTGSWPIIRHLEGPLWLPFLEPLILQHGLPVDNFDLTSFSMEDRDENLQLARLWDTNGLLTLLPPLPEGSEDPYTVRVLTASSLYRETGR